MRAKRYGEDAAQRRAEGAAAVLLEDSQWEPSPKRRALEPPSQTTQRSHPKPGPAPTYRKGGLTAELTVESFAAFYHAMAAEVCVRAERATSNDHLEKLPPRARGRFSAVRRCTWSWMTDSTSLALAGRLRTLQGASALRAIVLAQVAFTSPEGFADLCDATQGLDAAAVLRMIEDHQRRAAAKAQRPPKRSTISKSLQTGSLSRLPPGHTMNEKVAAFVTMLNDTVDSAWERIAAGERAVDVLTEALRLPDFRAHCVARWLWLATRHGESPESLGLGSGALDALQRLAGGAAEDDFRRVLPELRAAVEQADVGGLLPQLRRLGLRPDDAQTYEHLLCEAGKVFGTGRRDGRGAPRIGYKEAFDAALLLYARLP